MNAANDWWDAAWEETEDAYNDYWDIEYIWSEAEIMFENYEYDPDFVYIDYSEWTKPEDFD